ncbi:MAG: hypothetical protein HFI81_04450 [Eubacterium sp.]|nr:hypothetical protein [Eubacterium sp.]
MKKREFQRKATAALLKKLAEVCAGLGKNPNIAVSSRYNSSYFNLRCNGNRIQISVRETGELSYQLTDMLGSTGGRKIYYQYQEKDDFAGIIKKFTDDFGRLYKDFLMAGTLHGYYGMDFSYAADAGKELEEYENFISECV